MKRQPRVSTARATATWRVHAEAALGHVGRLRWQAAAQAWSDALHAAPGRSPAASASRLRQRLLLARADAWAMLGDLAAAERDVQQACPAWQDLTRTATGQRTDLARLCLVMGRVRFVQGRREEALALLQAGTRWAPAPRRGQHFHDALRPRMEVLQGATLSAMGCDREALAQLARPLRDLERIGGLSRLLGASAVFTNLGVAHWHLGDHDAAIDAATRALPYLQTLCELGVEGVRWQQCIVRSNLGGVCVSLADYAAALRHYAEADTLLAGLLAQVRRERGGDRVRLQALGCHIGFNAAYALHLSGALDAAGERMEQVCRRYARLGRHARAWQDAEAHAWVNLAHIRLELEQHPAALRLYARAVRRLSRLAASGRAHLGANVANARLGLARALLLQGRTALGTRHFRAAQNVLRQACRQGQLHRRAAWTQGVLEHAVLLPRAAGTPAALQVAAAAVLRVLADPPPWTGPLPRAVCAELDRLLDRLACWPADAAPGLQPVADALLRHLLGLMAHMLAESEPDALHAQAAQGRRLVQRLGQLAGRIGSADVMADWFLHTHGLRAQRNALVQGKDPAIQSLQRAQAELQALEAELLAQGLSRSGVETPRQLVQAKRWHELRQHCEQRRALLVQAGRLPPLQRLQARTLCAALAPDEALVLLARDGAQHLRVIVLTQQGAAWHAAGLRPADALRAAHASGHATAPVASLAVADGMRRGALLPLTNPAPALNPGPAHPWLPACRRSARRHFAAGLQALAAAGVRRLAWVPSADLHLWPWRLALAPLLSRCACAFSQWPDAAAWLMARSAAPLAAATRQPRWALVARPAVPGHPALPWVAVEAALTLRLWGARRCRPLPAPREPRADRVDGLFGMGHGWTPGHHLAASGLLLAPGRVLTAQDLRAIHHARHVWLSSCVLGRMDEVHGEALGFLSACFGCGTRFGAAWLVEVPDAEACLFSLAFQHALQAAERAAGGCGPDWGAVFGRVAAGVAGGRWPAGFGTWLAAELPPVVAALSPGPWLNRWHCLRDFDGGVYRRPPTTLRTLVPHAVALGW